MLFYVSGNSHSKKQFYLFLNYSFAQYLKSIEANLHAGNATEHTYRLALQSLIQSLAQGVVATNEPKRIACGAPDYIVTKSLTPLGYIEAKDVGKSLDTVERSEQIKRYLRSLGNFILTDYLEFRWYVAGERRLIGRLATAVKGKKTLHPDQNGSEKVATLLDGFLNAKTPTVNTPKQLAERMARLAQLIRDIIHHALEDTSQKSSLHQQLESFRKVLLRDLTREQFADMYAQTICYGMFAARCNTKTGQDFNRQTAAFYLPKTNPFLRQLFGHIAGFDLDDRITWAVDDLAELLKSTDIESILANFGKRTRQEDPVVHFYETFLAAYDPKLRKSRGVYYTPEPVVSYIVRSVDHILKTDFGLSDGLADATKIQVKTPDGEGTTESHKVLIADVATGTGAFLHGVINHIFESSFKHNQGMWSGYVSQHLLPRLFGFELLMAPYTVAHLKLGLQLAELGYQFDSEERLRIYLTNTLQEGFQIPPADGFTNWIKDEADAANKVKQKAPVMVLLGNPPYAGHSDNTGTWITNLLKGKDTLTNQPTSNYFEVDGKPLGEKNPKWLNDDYVKFIRFAQWRIEQTGYGILAFITNHSYLDNPTFRGMRQSLMETFDHIYLLDLHGNSKKKERRPDGSKDENIFDIQQGVAISIFVKRAGGKKEIATVRRTHLWGVREVYREIDNKRCLIGGKYHWLENNDIFTTQWTNLEPQSPFYLFVPQDTHSLTEYERGWKVTEMMSVNVLGFQTHRDHFAIDFDENRLYERISALRNTAYTDTELQNTYKLRDNRDWQLSVARKQLQSNKQWKQHFIHCLYRPFDWRACYFSTVAIDYPRRELLAHVAGRKNLCLNIVRQTKMESWQHTIVSNSPTPAVYVELKDGSNVFPLYLYPTDSKATLPNFDELTNITSERRPNLSPEFIRDFAARLGMEFIPDGKGNREQTFSPEDVFAYMYAVFHSPTYRQRYAEFLKIDFPRLPLTSNPDLFRALCQLGSELVSLHLMEKHGATLTSYPVSGNHTVDKVSYTEPGLGTELGRVWINKIQYFEGVSPEVWNFQVGGYQVCQKWLKDRKGRQLSYDDLTHYQRVVSALSETIRLMTEIDTVINNHGGYPLDGLV
jgi:predicted helicase